MAPRNGTDLLTSDVVQRSTAPAPSRRFRRSAAFSRGATTAGPSAQSLPTASASSTAVPANRRLLALTALAAMALAAVVLLGGWVFGVDVQKGWAPDAATMEANASILVLLCGLSLWCRRGETPMRRQLARTAAAAAALLAAAALSQHVVGWNLGIDRTDFSQAASPGRMSITTAVAFMLLGTAMVWLDHRLAEALAALALLPPLISLSGMAYSAPELMAAFSWNAIPLPTSLALVLLGIGVLAARPERGVARLLGSRGPEGVMARSTLLGAVGVLALVRSAAQAGYLAGFYSVDMRGALNLVGTLIGMIALLLWSATTLRRINADRQRGFDALQTSEERLRLLGDNLPDSAVYQFRRDAAGRPRLLYVSAGIERLIQIDVKTALSQPNALFSQVPPEWLERLCAEEARCAQDLSDLDMELPMRRPDGQWRWMRFKARPRQLSDGGLIWDGVQTDVTERRASEEALREQTALLRGITDSSPDLIFAKDHDGRMLLANPAALALVGRRSFEVLGRRDDEWLPDLAQARRIMENDRSVMADGRARMAEEHFGDRVFESMKAPLRNAEGSVKGVFGISRNVTAVRRAQEATRRSDERVHQAVTVARLGLFEIDHRSGEPYWSPRLREIIGWGFDEPVGLQAYREMIPPGDREAFVAAVHRAEQRDADGLYEIEHRLRRRDGQLRWLSVRGQIAFEGEGALRRPLRTVGAIADITERELLQGALRTANAELEDRVEQRTAELADKAVQLERASRVKSEFLANMSHELRTPLSAVLMLSELLAENPQHNLDERQIKYAHTVHEAGQDLLQLIDDILDLAKVEAGRIELDVAPVSLAGLINEFEQLFRPQCARKGLALAMVLDAGAPQQIQTDSRRLRQILKNLLANAVKFTESGEVRLEIALAAQGWPAGHAALAGATGVLALAVQDSGIGIAPDEQDIIFEPFRQADGSNARSYGGTGLGLAISRDLAHLLDGVVTLASTPGSGSRFTLWLPVAYEGAQLLRMLDMPAPSPSSPVLPLASPLPAAADPQDRQFLAGRTVLLVDDDVRNLFALTGLLEHYGMVVVQAQSGLEALETLTVLEAVDIVLTDVMMPGMDGYQAMRAIRAEPRHAALPLIALTAKAMKGDREKCLAAGASDYLSKPVEPAHLLRVLRRWLCG